MRVGRREGRVSFVIPTRDNARTIATCVRSAVSQPGDIEIIVVDNSSVDGTPLLAASAGADLVFSAGPERSSQRNRGTERSTGEIVVFIDSDMVLEPRLADELRRCFADPLVDGVILPERAFGEGYLANSRALEKRLALGDPAVEAARAFRAEVLDRVGGYDERFYGFEDFELADRVAATGAAIGRAAVGVLHDEGRIRLLHLLRKKHYYGTQWAGGRTGLHSNRMRARQIPTEVLRSDAIHIPGLAILKAVDLTGLAAGAIHASVRRRRTRRRRVLLSP